jgi:fructosamine-3-kinase
MSIPEHISKEIVARLGTDYSPHEAGFIGGGSINEAAYMLCKKGKFFIKWNSASRYPAMFEIEARSLELLQGKSALRIPQPLLSGESEKDAFLLTEFIESAPPAKDFWRTFAFGLAELHRNSNAHFGLAFDNYIGSLRQSNTQHSGWADFFVEERLLAQIRMARDNGLLGREHSRQFERLFHKVEYIFPEEKPALLHGDLWSGNFMTDEQGNACIFDPAVYYGHRIMDIGMTKMFGGFSPEFYQHYNEAFPMESNWTEQVEVANLYPTLVHLNLFGSGYLSGIVRVLKRFA